MEELYRHGHRRIAALISRPNDQSISQLRYEGYVQALESHGIPVDPELVISTGGFDVRDAYSAVKAALERGADFTALFAIADSMAIVPCGLDGCRQAYPRGLFRYSDRWVRIVCLY